MIEPDDNPTPIRSGRRGGWGTLRGLLPQRSDYTGLAASWRNDVVAGLTVGVVALPLALAFGIIPRRPRLGLADSRCS